MDDPKLAFKKYRRRLRRKRNPPPPLFNSDTPAFSTMSMPFDALPNMSVFPGNCVAAPSVPLNTNEMFDRFNQLLDWRLPRDGDNTHHPDNEGPVDPYADNDDRIFSPSRQNKRRITDSNDLRIRLDHQQSKRWKDVDDRLDYDGRRLPEPFDRSRIGDRVDVDDREERGEIDTDDRGEFRRFDIDDRGEFRRFDIDDRGEPRDHLAVRSADCWIESFGKSGAQDRRDLREERIVVKETELQNRWIEQPDRSSGRASDTVWSTSNAKPLDYDDGSRCWVDNRSYNSRDRWADDVRQDFGRQVKEYWPDRNQFEKDPPFHGSDDRWQGSSNERVLNQMYDIRYGDKNMKDEFRSQQRALDENERYIRENVHPSRWEGELHSGQHEERYESMNARKDDYFHDTYMPAGTSIDRSRSPLSRGVNDRPPSPYDNDSRNHTPNRDFVVIIHKPGNGRMTTAEADKLRSMLIDLVMNCGNAEQMPEFVTSGLIRGGRGFYVVCRTKESMDWLLTQSLPRLNNVILFMRRYRVYETVKISAFAPRCTRTRDEIMKLIKLQNGKKGFNFDEWSMRSYNTSPSGIYIAFDISLDEARLLKELRCQISLELKSLTFKIAVNSVQTVSEFPL